MNGMVCESTKSASGCTPRSETSFIAGVSRGSSRTVSQALVELPRQLLSSFVPMARDTQISDVGAGVSKHAGAGSWRDTGGLR